MTYRDRLLAAFAGSELCPNTYRPAVLRRIGADVGKRVTIFAGIVCQGGPLLHIGSDVFINRDCLIDAAAPVVIGDRVIIAPRCQIISSTHEQPGDGRRAGDRLLLPVRIGDGCWLGAGVTVLAGVTVGANTLLAAGAVVTKNCDQNSLYAGVPARKVRELPPV